MKVSDGNKNLRQSDENKEMIDKTKITSTSYSIKEEIKNKNIEVIYMKIKSVCRVKFDM